MNSSISSLSIKLLISIWGLLLTTSSARVPTQKIKGMAFTSGHDLWAYRQPFAAESLRNLKKTGTKYVHITVILGMENLSSTTSYEVTDEKSMRYILRKVKRFGFKVFLKPIVQTRNFEWRGYIKGRDIWFKNVYNPYIVKMAKIAEEEKVDIFAVGSELKATISRTEQWQNTIRLVKQHFKRGCTTYVANHDSYKMVRFWNSLDFISISGYFELLDQYNPNNPPNQKWTNQLWNQQAQKVINWRNRNNLWSKKILLAEAGAMSKGNGITYTEPFAWAATGPTDLKVQKMQYIGLFNAFMTKKWCLGVILYDWEARPNAGKEMPLIQHYTPQNKPAQAVMTKYFKQSYPKIV